MIDQRLAHYTISAKIGAGGMGEVYRATDTKLGREVALKVLPADLSGDPERLARFQREAELLEVLCACLLEVPEYCRVTRVIREPNAGSRMLPVIG